MYQLNVIVSVNDFQNYFARNQKLLFFGRQNFSASLNIIKHTKGIKET